jgi:cation transport regulator ChaC
MGHVSCFLRNGDRVFLTYSMTGRGTEAASGSVALALRPAGNTARVRPAARVAADPAGATRAEALGRNGHHH